MSKYHVCKDDIVKVNAGNFKGMEATVKAILPK
jgi:ribosomal protein L24